MTDEVVDRLLKSRRIYWAWREMPPAGSIEDMLRMVNEEIAWLEKLAEQHPGRAAKIGRMCDLWRVMAREYRAKAN